MPGPTWSVSCPANLPITMASRPPTHAVVLAIYAPPSPRQRRYPEQIEQAIAFGATGIGLIRTDHMFYDGDRIDSMREMILAETQADREAALAKLFPQHRDDFREIFGTPKGLPATIRLLDPPLHEFLPHDIDAQKQVAQKLNLPVEKIMKCVQDLHEFN